MIKKYLFPSRWYLLLIAIGLLGILDLYHPGLPLTHDGQDHAARIANFYQSLADGNIVPRWAGNLNWGYGHPILMFLYPLPSYFASLFHFLSFSLVDSVKIVFGLSFLASGIAMYLFVREITDEFSGFIAGLLYMIAPYRFIDLYVRGAIGEHMAFVFPPLILYFLLKLSKRYSYLLVIGLTLSFAGLLLSHNAMSLMFLPIIVLYATHLLLQQKKRRSFFFTLSSGLLLGIGLAAFFLLPAFLEGKYTLRDIVTSGGEYASNFVPFENFLFGEWNYGGSLQFTKQIGYVQWTVVLASVVLLVQRYKEKNREWWIVAGALVFFGLSLFLMLKISDPVWQSVSILQKFQFPWRFLSVTVFLTATLAGIVTRKYIRNHRRIAGIFLVGLVLFLHRDYWHAENFLQNPESFYTGIYYGTTDTGESAPLWSTRFMEKEPKKRVAVLEGDATIQEVERSSTKHVFLVDAKKQSKLLENTLYFPGWNVRVNGVSSVIQFQDRKHHGVMEFYVPKGQSTVTVQFSETKLRTLANLITILSIFVLFSYTVFSTQKLFNKGRNTAVHK